MEAMNECCYPGLALSPALLPAHIPSASLPHLGSCADRSLAGLGVPVHGELTE